MAHSQAGHKPRALNLDLPETPVKNGGAAGIVLGSPTGGLQLNGGVVRDLESGTENNDEVRPAQHMPQTPASPATQMRYMADLNSPKPAKMAINQLRGFVDENEGASDIPPSAAAGFGQGSKRGIHLQGAALDDGVATAGTGSNASDGGFRPASGSAIGVGRPGMVATGGLGGSTLIGGSGRLDIDGGGGHHAASHDAQSQQQVGMSTPARPAALPATRSFSAQAGSTAGPVVHTPPPPIVSLSSGSSSAANSSTAAAPSPAAEADDGEIPAALAALLHQTDKSGKQQKATPHSQPSLGTPHGPGGPGSPHGNQAQYHRNGQHQQNFGTPAAASAAASPLLQPGSNSSSVVGSSGAGSSSSTPAGTPSAVRRGGGSGYTPSGSGSGGHLHTSKPAARGIFGALCCYSPAALPVEMDATGVYDDGKGDVSASGSSATPSSSSSAASSPQGGGRAGAASNVSSGRSSPANTHDANNRTISTMPHVVVRGESSGTSAGSSPAAAAGGHTKPALALSLSRTVTAETPSRRNAPNAGKNGGKTPLAAGSDTPSRVLSPTSLTARTAHDAYGRQAVPPWGSQHPSVVHSHFTNGYGHGAGQSTPAYGRQGSKTPTAATPMRSNSSAVSPTNGSKSTGKRRSVRKTKRGPRPAPPPHRVNNVRRPASSFGQGPLLAPLMDCDVGKPCLVLDLDETLVHSSFKPVPNPDYVLPVEIEGTVHHVYVCKRPGCDVFLEKLGQCYEVVIFTASLAKYADPLLDLLDPHNVIRARLFREACVFHEGNYVKDLSLLGRDARYTIIVDNSPASYIFQPENALACDSFIDDRNDSELFVLLEFLEEIRRCKDVRPVLGQWAQGLYGGPRTLSLHSDSEGEGGGAGAYHEALGFGSAGDESEGDDAAVVGGGNGEGGAGGNAHNLTTATHAAAVGTTSHSSNSIVAGMSNARIGNNNNNSGGGGDGKASYEDDHTEVHYQHQPQQQLRKLSSGQSRQAIQQQQQQQQQSGMQRQTSGADRGHNYRGQWA